MAVTKKSCVWYSCEIFVVLIKTVKSHLILPKEVVKYLFLIYVNLRSCCNACSIISEQRKKERWIFFNEYFYGQTLPPKNSKHQRRKISVYELDHWYHINRQQSLYLSALLKVLSFWPFLCLIWIKNVIIHQHAQLSKDSSIWNQSGVFTSTWGDEIVLTCKYMKS